MGETGLAKFFKFAEKGTSYGQEIRGGVTTFLAMVYILAVNPNILSATGMPEEAIFVATALSAGVATIYAALRANLPIALASGMGLNAYFAYTVCLGMGYPWQMCLTAVLFEGLIFLILGKLGIRKMIFDAIPNGLRKAISMGIGLFIALIGFINAKIIVPDAGTTIAHYNFRSGGAFTTIGITVLLAIIGIVITCILLAKRTKGAILIGVAATWILGIICEKVGIYVPDVDAGMFSVWPKGIVSISNIGVIKETLFAFDFSFFKEPTFYFVTFSFLFVDIFDTLGTLMGCAIEGGMINEEGNIENMNEALEADAVGTMVGACLGTSTVTTFVESTSGIAEGAKTGFASIITGALFILSLFFSPLFLAIPSFATAPALVAVGILMIKGSAKEIEWRDFTEAIPAFMAMVMMPFAYSISMGIAYGFIFYTVVKLFVRKYEVTLDDGTVDKRNGWDDLNVGLVVIAILFVLKFIIFGS